MRRWIVFTEVFDRRTRDSDGSPEVDLELRAGGLIWRALDDAIQAVPGVVNDNIKPAEVVDNAGNEIIGRLGGVGDVMLNDQEFQGAVECCKGGERDGGTGDSGDALANGE